jgi:hypothetical protein
MAAPIVDSLTPKQEETITALLTEPTVAKAAAKVGVTDRTIYRWLDEPGFSKAYHGARRQAFRHAVNLAVRIAPMAVNTFGKVMTDATAPHASKVAAANGALKFGRESIELDELVERIERLERSEDARKNGGAD